MADDPKKKEEARFAVVQVTESNRDGSGRFVVKETHTKFGKAAEEAQRCSTWAVVTFDKEPQKDSVHGFGPGHPRLTPIANELEYQKEHARPVYVCRMEGRHGKPKEEMDVKYTLGRSSPSMRPEERTAEPLHRSDQSERTNETYYVVVQRYSDTAKREGKVIGVYLDKEAAIQHQMEYIQRWEQQAQAPGLGRSPLAEASIAGSETKAIMDRAREVAQQIQERRRAEQGMER